MLRLSPRQFATAQAGVAAIEFALILPFMLMLYFGLMDLTGLISFNRKITSVANTMADLVGQNRSSVLLPDINDYMKSEAMIMSPTPASNVTVKLFGYRMQAGTPTQIWKTTNSAGPGCSSAPSVSAMIPLMAAGNDLIVSQACYVYTPYVATFLGDKLLGSTTIKVEQTIMVRPRTTAKLDCFTSTAMTTSCT